MRRRTLLAAGATGLLARPLWAFGQEGAFNPRMLITGTSTWKGRRKQAPARWSNEVILRTIAPARRKPTIVRADAPELLAEPFVIWAGRKAPERLTRAERRGLWRFLTLGGVLLVDEHEPLKGVFLKHAIQELARVLPQGSPIEIGQENVVFRSYYLLREATGRIQKSPKLKAIIRGGAVSVILSPNDLLGALAGGAGGVHAFEVKGGARQRALAIRLAINIAMYVLCSNYKDDQVHAPFLMRRRASRSH